MDDRGDPTLIDLAREPAFPLGRLEVRPATLEVIGVDRREQLEPRIMQVLVALARRRGEVVSRDELVASCWGGRIVGDDSINRCISRLRKLAEALGGFTIETVPRVGFRLTGQDGPGAPGASGRTRVLLAVALALLVATASFVAVRLLRPLPAGLTTQARVVVLPFTPLGDDPQARALSAQLVDDIAGVMGESGLSVATMARPDEGQPPRLADLLLGGTVSQDSGDWRVRAYLEDRASKTVVWSATFARSRGDEAALRDQVAVAVTETLYNLHMSQRQRGLRLDPTTLALYLRATAALIRSQQPFQPGESRRLYEQVVARAPNFAPAHGQLAVALVVEAGDATEPGRRSLLMTRARKEAELGARLDPSTSDSSFGALYLIARAEGSPDIAAAEKRYLLSRLEVTDQPWLAMYECRLQIELGRARESLPACQRGIALRPLATQVGYSYAVALQMVGDQEGADREIDRMFRYYPQHDATRRIRFDLAAFGGSAARALAMLEGPNRKDNRAEGRAALEAFLHARQSARPADVEQAMGLLWAAARNRQLDPEYVVRAAAMFGRPDEAFRALDEPSFDFNYSLGFLFTPGMAPLHQDPRFWRLASKLGYARYWREQNAWPDFCGEAGAPDCRALAAAAGV